MINFFQGIGNFFNTIFSNWQGLLIGLALAGIIILILALTAFKQNAFALKFFGTILLLVLGIGGAFLQSFMFPVSSGDLPTIAEINQLKEESMQKYYVNTNGFSVTQVKQAQQDDACPTAEDEYINLTIQDYGDYVCFYYSEPVEAMPLFERCQNLTFIKSVNGLISDGMLMASCSYPEKMNGSIFSYTIKYDNIKWTINKFSTPKYEIGPRPSSIGNYHNLVSLSTPSPRDFCSGTYSLLCNNSHLLNKYLLQDALKLVGSNFSTYHISWNENLELSGTSDTVNYDVNTFYTYLYDSIKNERYDTTKLIDGNGYICKVIPEEERLNYPVSEEFKQNNPDIDYYSVYRCNLGINLTYVEGNRSLSANNDRQKEYIEENKENVGEPQTPTNIYSLSCNFNDVSTKEHTSTPNLVENPIKITFSKDNLIHTLTIKSFEDLTRANQVLLKAKGTWNYEIKSDRVIFKTTKGTFNITSAKSSIEFDFEYYDDYVPYTISLSPASSVDLSKLDLTATPVTIILLNDTNQFTFTFDTLEELTNGITQDVKLGTYNYTIISDALTFDPLNGTLEVSANNTEYIFNYEYSSIVPLSLTLSVTNNESAADSLYISEASVSAIKNAMTKSEEFKLEINIYTYASELINTIEYEYTGTSEIYSSLLTLGLAVDTPYQFQIKIIDLNDDNIVYVSNVTSGTQTLTHGLNLTLEVSEI